MRQSDIQTVSEFISDEIENRELSFSPAYIRDAREAWSAFERVLAELSRLQSIVPCYASESVRSGNRKTGEKDG
jgi:hypothetical protein